MSLYFLYNVSMSTTDVLIPCPSCKAVGRYRPQEAGHPSKCVICETAFPHDLIKAVQFFIASDGSGSEESMLFDEETGLFYSANA